MIKFADFTLWEVAARFAWNYHKIGVRVNAPIRVDGRWVVKYQLIGAKK